VALEALPGTVWLHVVGDVSKNSVVIALFALVLLSAAGVMLEGPMGGARESEETGIGDGI
jgi:phage terminase large subunit-like protein